MSASLRWSEGTATWETTSHDPSLPTPNPNPSLPSIQSLSSAVALSADNHSLSSGSVMHTSSSLHDNASGSEKSTTPTTSTISSTAELPIATGTTATAATTTAPGGFLSTTSLVPSTPSSPDSFCSANSGFPPDDTDTVSTLAPVLDVGPCPICIRNCALVASAVVRGDLGVRISCKREACNHSALTISINQMVSKLANFTTEVIQAAAQGVEGKLGVQAKIKDEHGIWKEFVSHLNTMTVGHSEQVRDIASVCTAVAHGDLSQKITVPVKGETLVLKNTINTMVDQLRSFSSEVTRVAHEVGTEGKLGGQARVEGVDGTWKELTDNVNTMAANLTAQVRDIANVSKAVAKGDLSKKISVEVKGEMMDLKNTINTMVDQLQEFATEVSRVSLEVGTEGKLGGQAVVKDVSGTWKELTDNVNLMASNLTGQVRDVAAVCKAVVAGDLTKKVTVPVQGEILELKETVNTVVDQLRRFAAEVTRVAREVGTEGKLGGQAEVEGVDGTWKELTDNVNTMAANLTAQVRDIANV
ncbi:hypothetical protein BGX20_005483, partial [Mortierella sp. AD010]